MRRTIGSVLDEINEWQRSPGESIYYVTAFFTDKEVLSVGKKDMDAALEVRGLLQEVINVPQEFVLESKGQSKSGLAKWNLKAFGPPEGVWTYSTIKGGQPEVGAGNTLAGGSGSQPGEGSTPSVQVSAPTNNVEASIRASVAAKAAGSPWPIPELIERAEAIDAWLAKKSGGTAGSMPPDQGEGAGQGEGLAPSSDMPKPDLPNPGQPWTERVKDWPTDSPI